MTQFSEQSLWSWLLVFSFLFLSSNLSSELLLQLKCRSAILSHFFQQIGIYDYIHCYSFSSLHFLHLNLIKFQVFCDFLSLEAPDCSLPKSSCLLLVIIIIIFLSDPGPIIVRNSLVRFPDPLAFKSGDPVQELPNSLTDDLVDT